MSEQQRPGSSPGAPRTGAGPFAHGGHHLRRALAVDLAIGTPLPDEAAFVEATPEGTEAPYARLLLWRRSMLYLGFLVLLPSLLIDTVTVIVQLADNDVGGIPVDKDSLAVQGGLRFLVVCLNVALAFGVFAAFRRWSDWAGSRKVLRVMWLVAFVAPFAIALFPMRSIGGGNAAVATLLGLAGALQHVVELAPKVLALIPGLLRAAVSAKVLFPRTTAPGWLVTLASPFYLLLLFVIMMLPYQLTGSPLLVLAMLCFLLGPVWLWRAGTALARPSTQAEAVALVKRTRGVSLALNIAGALFLFVGVATSAVGLDVGSVLKVLFGVAANIFILSVVAVDALVGGLTRARETAREAAARDEADPMDGFLEAASAASASYGASTLTAAQERSKP
ncbi:MAG: hypothetical protein EP329_03510 [Deltaproteobacteria bacterium]|nr:MAG: hypothetical protein EP329_03510 [Deltaproteobacteria bacterium]